MNWQDGMKEALIAYVLCNGALVKEAASRKSSGHLSYGGWQEHGWDEEALADIPDPTRHMRDCRVNLGLSSYEDSDWHEFGGTFAEPPWDHRTGVDAVIWCACGHVQGRRWRYTGSLADLIRAITAPQEPSPREEK